VASLQIDHNPKEPSRAALAGVGLIQIVVVVAGMGFIGWVRANYSHQVGDWIFSLFGQ
jgi:hypothetical protein